jgi:enoyl-CoA hydratase/carnithine racemase
MSDIITESSGAVLRVQLNRPAQKNAMTSSMYTSLADILNEADKDDAIRVVLWHGAGDAFCAGNDVVDFLKNPPGPGEFPQGRLMEALVGFDKPIVAAVQGAAIGGGTTMLTHCDLVYAGESAKFQMPFINLGWCRNSDRAFRYRRAWTISERRNWSCRESPSLPRGRSISSLKRKTEC